MPLSQDTAVMGHLCSAVDQSIPQCLIYRDGSFTRIKPYRPRGCQLRLGRKIQTQSNAELALLPVDVLLQLSAAQVGRQINIGRLDRFAHDRANRIRNLVMEEPRHTFIVRDVAPQALFVAQSNASLPDGMPVVAAQSCEVERVNQVAERHISLLAKLFRALRGNLS